MTITLKTITFAILFTTLVLASTLTHAFPRTIRINGCILERFRTTRAYNTYQTAQTDAENFSGSYSDCVSIWIDYMNACEAYWNQYQDHQLECLMPDGTAVEQLNFEAQIEGEVNSGVEDCTLTVTNAIVNEC